MYQGNMYSGGQGVYLYYLTRELARMGHDVHVIAGPPYPTLAAGMATVDAGILLYLKPEPLNGAIK